MKNINMKQLMGGILLLLGRTTFGLDPDCYQAGECVGDIIVAHHEAASLEECFDFCQEEQYCSHFTFYSNIGICNLMAGCENLSADSCDSCFTGAVSDCAVCSQPGNCLGPFVSNSLTLSENLCLLACQGDERCKWYSYDSSAYDCILLSECSFVDSTCPDCIFGQSVCNAAPVPNRLIVVGGYNAAGNYELSSEVLALDRTGNDTSPCESLGDLPDGRGHATGAVLGDRVVVCGGYKLTDCVYYNDKQGAWNFFAEMGEQHWDAAAVQVDDKTLWIAGGRERDQEEVLASSVIVKKTGEVMPGPQLPEPRDSFCAVKVNSTHIFVAGGQGVDSLADYTTYMLEWKTRTWTRLADMPGAKRTLPSCAYLPFSNEVLVVGGYQEGTALAYDLTTGSWKAELSNPGGAKMQSAKAVPYQGSFLLVGGYYDNIKSDVIYLFDFEHRAWVDFGQTLSGPRNDHVALLAHESISNC